MSDVDKTISGLSDSELKRTATTKFDSDSPNKTATLRYQHQHQHNHNHHHHHPRKVQQQSIKFYSNSTSGSAIVTDSTTTITTPTPASAPTPATPSCRNNNCVSRILKLIFSTPGLVLLVVGYSVMGALIFPLLEAQQDLTKSAVIAKSREDCLRELWIITEKLNVLYERNWTMLVHEQLRRFEGSIVAATRNGIATTTSLRNGPSTAVGHFGGNLDAWDQARWSFSEALLYSVTVITTIGHGSLTPRTPAGKIATIMYAIIGVPLMLMCLSSLGALLADALQSTYAKLCCRGHTTETIDSDDIKRRQDDCGYPDCQQDDSKGQELNCKNCKYDAIAVGAALHHPYECNDSIAASDGTISHGKNEDSCRLLHNSPKAKTNHNSSPCMQLKMTPQQAATIAKYYHHQKQQQQHQQQQQSQVAFNRIQSQATQPLPPPSSSPSPQLDVMVLATTTVTPTPTLTATSVEAAATTLARPNVDASPHHLPHTLQPATATTFHIVSNSPSPQLSSSAHSSPIHYNSNHQHQNNHHSSVPAPSILSQQLAMRQYGNSMPQHFVAIPSSMVRFQVAPNNNKNSNNTQSTFANVGNGAVPPNCYQPTASASPSASPSASSSTSTSVTVTGAATIYFPGYIAGTVGTVGGGIGATTTMARPTTSIGAASSQLLCNQPLVKYHTIQLQHKKPPTTFSDDAATSGSSTAILKIETDASLFNAANALPLPPPPAYQTATVHGVRRAKFIAKPLPPEINSLLAASDATAAPFRHDLSAAQQNSTTTTSTAAAATTPPTTATIRHFEPTKTATTICSNDSILLLSTGCTTTPCISSATTSMPGAYNLATLNGGESLVTLPANATSTLPTNCTFNGSNVTVDIMEDEEEEQEQQGLGTCPHGTPSRMPLIPNTSGGGDGKHGLLNTTNSVGIERDYDRSARGLINATAASFHRHTLQTFHRGNSNGNGNGNNLGLGGGNSALRNSRKSTLVTHQGSSSSSNGNNMHSSTIWKRRSSNNGCYGVDPNADTSEDDDYRHSTNNEHYALEQFNAANFSEDVDDDVNAGTDDDELEPYAQNGPQVPISIVLLILVCYVSLGTVIFALWENWSLIDGAYFCFVTLATIGYGDFIPERTFQGPEVQLFACCAYLLLGLVLVAMAFSILETQLIWKCKRIAVRLRLTNN